VQKARASANSRTPMADSTSPKLVDFSRLSCSTICFRNYSLDAALSAIKELGIQNVDIGAMPGFCPHFDFLEASQAEEEAFIQTLQNCGIKINSFTTLLGHPNASDADIDRMIEAGRRNIRVAVEVGARGIVFTGGKNRDRGKYPLIDDIEKMVQFLKPLVQECQEAGLVPMMETPHKGSLLRTPEEADLLWSALDSPWATPILDINHYEAVGWSAKQAVSHLSAPRIGIIHLRDGVGRENRNPLGTGEIDFLGLFRALHAGGYRNLYSFEFSDSANTIEGDINCLQESINYLLSINDSDIPSHAKTH